jgi:hypothetical protein
MDEQDEQDDTNLGKRLFILSILFIHVKLFSFIG